MQPQIHVDFWDRIGQDGQVTNFLLPFRSSGSIAWVTSIGPSTFTLWTARIFSTVLKDKHTSQAGAVRNEPDQVTRLHGHRIMQDLKLTPVSTARRPH